MNKSANEVIIRTEAASIYIEQSSTTEDQSPGLHSVVITPDQVDLIIDWLKEAKEDASNTVGD